MNEVIKRGQIYYAELDPVQGSEEGGRRPCLVIQNNAGNLDSPTTIVAPLTGRPKHGGHALHVPLDNSQLYPGSMALLEQIRTIDKSRLRRYICTISEGNMRSVERAIHTSLELKCYLEGETK